MTHNYTIISFRGENQGKTKLTIFCTKAKYASRSVSLNLRANNEAVSFTL